METSATIPNVSINIATQITAENEVMFLMYNAVHQINRITDAQRSLLSCFAEYV